MEIKAVLFDLDGTLLPMNQEIFTKAYFHGLTAALSPLGAEPKTIVDAVWDGTRAMMKNDGQKRNVDVFWTHFSSVLNVDARKFREVSDCFYTSSFHNARTATDANPLAKTAVSEARKNGRRVVLATNPIFPMDGQRSRLSWLDLAPEDFDLVTSYETDSFCKPNPQYFLSVCERIGVKPENCLMIGNDETEDMYAGKLAGLNTYLVTDCCIKSKKHPFSGQSGSFSEMLEMLKNL